MRRPLAVFLGAAAFTATAPAAILAASAAARTLHVDVKGENVRVVVPHLFEPLLPGSVYPNRRRERPPHREPVVVVERSLAHRAEPYLLARGLVVAELDRIDRATIESLLETLGQRLEGGIGGASLLARSAGDALGAPNLRAAALFDPAELPPPPDSARGCIPVAVFRRLADGAEPGLASESPSDCIVERWFRSNREIPDAAFRDAAEWLAETSRARN